MALVPTDSQALFLPTQFAPPQNLPAQRTLEIKKIQNLLENKIVRQRLQDLGLSEGEITTRLAQLSDQEVHALSTHIDSLIPGGDSGLGIVIALLVIAILVVLLLHLTGHRIFVTK
jgi:hypothetical protein